MVAAAAVPATASAAALPPMPPVTPMAPPPPIVYSAPPRPPKPRVPGPGKVGYLLALAWIPITIAITLYLSTTGQLAVFGVIAGGVIYVAGLGVILVITALRGRKLGFLGFLSVVAMIPVAVAIGAAPELRDHYASGDWHDWVNEQVAAESSSMPSLAEPSIGTRRGVRSNASVLRLRHCRHRGHVLARGRQQRFRFRWHRGTLLRVRGPDHHGDVLVDAAHHPEHHEPEDRQQWFR